MTHDSHVAKTATVKNLFDSSLAGDTKQRIMELHHHSQRLWGNMTVAQALAHCTSGLEMAMGVINPKRAPFPANVIGLLIKPLVFGNDKPMRRNSPSSRELFSAGHSIATRAAPINHKAGLKPQLSDEFSLTATVASVHDRSSFPNAAPGAGERAARIRCRPPPCIRRCPQP